MPSYIQQIRRIPKPGKSESVLQRSIERFKSLNRRGNVNFTISASGESEAPSPLISLVIRHQTLSHSTMLSEVVPTPSKCSMKSQRNVQRWNYICTESWSPVSSHKEAQNTILGAYSSLKEVKFKMFSRR